MRKIVANDIINAPIAIVPTLVNVLLTAFINESGGPSLSFSPSWNYYQLVNMDESMNLKKQSVNQYQ